MTESGREPYSEVVNIIKIPQEGQGRWQPVVGSETEELLRHVRLEGQDRQNVLNQALEVLSRSVPPTAPVGKEIGLAVGYVQSGKTMSFTTVAALARDNGYRLVIVLTGISRPLLSQSTARLQNDLRLETRPDRKWKAFRNPSPRGNEREQIENSLDNWNDRSVPDDERQTILITVMKNVTHVRNLITLLSAMRPRLDRVSTLVIDDEADQAGLNTRVREGEQSATYRQLIDLRRVLPQHTFLQYTATPQAPLLINMIDMLSPSFAYVLTPGQGYTGGKTFFIDDPRLIQLIPGQDIPDANHHLTEPPESLMRAMRVFFVGVAAGRVLDASRGNRSMMVHPSQETQEHAQYAHWVRHVKDLWARILLLPEDQPDRRELIHAFVPAYEDLKQTVNDLPTFPALVERLPRAIRDTVVTEVNSRAPGGTPQINWRQDYSHILVGGQALDRGFTVEGLTVTYMPRSLGVGNADTIQQRARFFGYKRGYLGYCRVYLAEGTRREYRNYVTHEEDIRSQLTKFHQTGRRLSDWKRAFFLSGELKPTRACVLDLDYMRINFADKWFEQKSPHIPEEAVEANRLTVREFLSGLQLVDDDGHPERTASQRHKVATGVPLRQAFEGLLTRLRMGSPGDSQPFTGLMLQLGSYLDVHPDETCTIYRMSEDRERRSLDNREEILNLFQGAHPDKSGSIYPGDRYVRTLTRVTIQIHDLTLVRL